MLHDANLIASTIIIMIIITILHCTSCIVGISYGNICYLLIAIDHFDQIL